VFKYGLLDKLRPRQTHGPKGRDIQVLTAKGAQCGASKTIRELNE